MFAVLVLGHAVFAEVASAWETKSLVSLQESRLGAVIDIAAVAETAEEVAVRTAEEVAEKVAEEVVVAVAEAAEKIAGEVAVRFGLKLAVEVAV